MSFVAGVYDKLCNRVDRMNEAEFIHQAEETMIALEDAIDEANGPLDYENNGAVLSIDCEDTGSQVIVSRQLAMQQIWVAAKSGGFHCDWDGQQWQCTTTSESLLDLLNRVLSEQSTQAIELTL